MAFLCLQLTSFSLQSLQDVDNPSGIDVGKNPQYEHLYRSADGVYLSTLHLKSDVQLLLAVYVRIYQTASSGGVRKNLSNCLIDLFGSIPKLFKLSFIFAAFAILVRIPPGCTQRELTPLFSISSS